MEMNEWLTKTSKWGNGATVDEVVELLTIASNLHNVAFITLDCDGMYGEYCVVSGGKYTDNKLISVSTKAHCLGLDVDVNTHTRDITVEEAIAFMIEHATKI